MNIEVPEIRSVPVSPRPATVVPATEDIEAAPLEMGGPRKRGFLITEPNPKDAWLPITGSRNGNAYYAAFHTICSGIGFQALIIPVAFTFLGWAWGIVSLSLLFMWQLYTIWLLIQLHESTETGVRYSRYLHLFKFAFGKKLTNILALLPIIYLSVGTCALLIIIGGSTLRLFLDMVCGYTCTDKPLTPILRYFVFTCVAVVLSQLPKLNSLVGVSLIGAITGICYCIMTWVMSLTKGRLPMEDYEPFEVNGGLSKAIVICYSIGLIVMTFRGHNLILEIQATMPSSEKHPSRVPMWKGVKFAYLLIALCIFPIAIVGHWGYGYLISIEGGLLTALYELHFRDRNKSPPSVLILITILVIVSTVSSFPIYGMPIFDLMESKYTTKMNKPCPPLLRVVFRAVFGFGCFFIAVAIPFLGSLGVGTLLGGLVLPVALAYPCFMWIKIKKPKVFGFMWWINWGLGILGTALGVVQIAVGLYFSVAGGFRANFFNPK